MPGDYSPRSSEDHSPNGSDEGDPRCPLSKDILRKHIPKGFERPPTLPAYDGLTDPDDHIANVNANLDFRNISGAIRCRLFPTTLRKGAMTWYQSLPPQFIHSWRDLTEQFCRHFTASRKHPKTVHALEAIYQAEEETLRNFVERFNKEAVQVETTDDMKKYLLQRGLRPSSDFAKAVGIEKPPTWDDLLLKAQKYIEYEEVQAADVARLARLGSSHPARESSHRSDDRGGDRGNDRGGDRGGERGRDRRRGERRESRGPPSTFSTYTPLVKSRGEIFAEVHISEFNRAGVKQPKPTPLKPGQDKNRYCRYHKSYGHRTDDCIKLNDAIEIMIRSGQLREFVKRNNDHRPETAETRTVEEVLPQPAGQNNAKQIAMSVSRPEDFAIPSGFEDIYTGPTLSTWDYFTDSRRGDQCL
ncbi:uncharacterized protein LOC123904916 [Trifolium pratense]|uniref:uncharacterized protein LOC123904916 n=1 Tax=Trifolium pratense TaxID=57577 RepID=UPI001E69429F|nr:uncharacterized protein LOC123904916 [Trifolium pratense]